MSSLVSAYQHTVSSGLFVNELGHALVALPAIVIIWKKTKSKKLAAIPFVMAYVLDIDHLLDYWGYYGFGFDPLKFVKLDYFEVPGRAFILLHAWEWVLVLLIISYRRGWNSLITAFTLGLLSHVVWDALTVGSFFFYSIIYRYVTGFSLLTLL